MDKHTLIFLHIPKAAGTTMHKIIERQYGETSIFTMDGSRVMESSDEIKNLPVEIKNKIKVLKGHMAFGLHSYMPRPCRYFTLLREPVERLISHYYYVIRTPKHYLYETVTSKKMTLEDYVRSDLSYELNNGQTRLLGSKNGCPIENDIITQYDLIEAKKNLDNSFELVGLTDQFDETLLLAKQAFGWKNISYSRSNVRKNFPVKQTITDKVITTILDNNKYDSELYVYANMLFDNSLRHYDGNFDEDLNKFRRNNVICSYRMSVINKVKNKIKFLIGKN